MVCGPAHRAKGAGAVRATGDARARTKSRHSPYCDQLSGIAAVPKWLQRLSLPGPCRPERTSFLVWQVPSVLFTQPDEHDRQAVEHNNSESYVESHPRYSH